MAAIQAQMRSAVRAIQCGPVLRRGLGTAPSGHAAPSHSPEHGKEHSHGDSHSHSAHDHGEPEYYEQFGSGFYRKTFTVIGGIGAFAAQHQYLTREDSNGVRMIHPLTKVLESLQTDPEVRRNRIVETLKAQERDADNLILLRVEGTRPQKIRSLELEKRSRGGSRDNQVPGTRRSEEPIRAKVGFGIDNE